jgi:hypothetical protein
MLEYEAVLTRPAHLAACGLSGTRPLLGVLQDELPGALDIDDARQDYVSRWSCLPQTTATASTEAWQSTPGNQTKIGGWLMKKLLLAGWLMWLLLLGSATAQNAFDGTWKVDMSSVEFPKKPDVYLLQNGTFECKSCVPPISIKADGMDQKVTGHPFFDTLSVKAVDDHNVEQTNKRDGKVVGTEKDSVSVDGETLTGNWTDSGEPSGGTQAGSYTAKRVAKGPAGANMISGSWRTEKADNPASVLTWTYKVNGDELSMSNPTGQSYTAKLDGSDAP